MKTESQTDTRTEIESLIDGIASRFATAEASELPQIAARCRELADEAEALAARFGEDRP